MNKEMVSLENLKKFLELNNLNIFQHMWRSMEAFDLDDFIALLKCYEATGDNLTKDYLLCQNISDDSDESDLMNFIETLKNNRKFNPEYLYDEKDIEHNIKWANERLAHLEYKKTSKYQYEQSVKRKAEILEAKAKTIKNRENKVGFIYLIYDGEAIKIGQTKYLSQRLSSISVEIKKDISLLHHAQVIGYELREKELHKMFEAKNVKGEWFNLDDDDILIVKEYLKQYATNN